MCRFTNLLKRHRLTLVALGSLGLAGALGFPHARAYWELRAARVADARYRPEETREHLRTVLATWPNHREANLLAARAARRSEDFDDAEACVLRARGQDRDPPTEVALEFAMYHAHGGDLGSYEEYLRAQVHRQPDAAPLILEALAAGYIRLARVLDAEHTLNQWLEVDPKNVQALLLRGNLRRQVSAYPKAVEDYRKAAELDPGHTEIRRWLGHCLLEVGRYEEALGHLEAAHKARPDDPNGLIKLARCQEKLGQKRQAKLLLERVLETHPGHGAALRVRGLMSFLDGDLETAYSWLQRAAEASPHDYEAQWSLYRCLNEMGRSAEASTQLARAEALKDRLERLAELATRLLPGDPNNPEWHCEMGLVLFDLGNPDGERWLQSAVGLKPDHGPAHAALADLYSRRGDTQREAEHRRLARGATAPTPGKPSRPRPAGPENP